jgi:hypothetical protein
MLTFLGNRISEQKSRPGAAGPRGGRMILPKIGTIGRKGTNSGVSRQSRGKAQARPRKSVFIPVQPRGFHDIPHGTDKEQQSDSRIRREIADA